MKIICDSCQTKYSIADDKVRGKIFKIKCKKCSHVIVVRGGATDDEPKAPVDEKVTKVFDYTGYEDARQAAAAMAAADAGEAVWHLVIDQEQVGPMTAAEVKARLDAGDIDAESYTWREGFGDWQRLAAVDELASVISGGAAGFDYAAAAGYAAAGADAYGSDYGTGGVMFGAAGDESGKAQADPGDLFSAQAGDAAAGDLFAAHRGGGYDQPMSSGGDAAAGLFGGGGGGSGAVAARSGVEIDSQLTGQRNENSVLFSLSNLASLASDAPKASAASAARDAGPGAAQVGGKEGSGLIDIRSMASVYLGDQQRAAGGAAAGRGATDDLPVFGSGFDAGGAHVLLPTGSSGPDKNVVYALFAGIGLLALAIIVLLFIVIRGAGDAPQPPPQLAAVTETDPDDKGRAGRRAPDDERAPPAMAPPDDEPEADEPEADEPEAEKPEAEKPEPAAADDDQSARASRPSRRSSGAAKPAPRARPSTTAASSGSSASKENCDEVACLVDPSLPCCGKSSRSNSRGGSPSASSSADSDLPERPGRTDVSTGITAVRGRVQSCGDKNDFAGTVTVKLVIDPSGKVSSASADKGSGAFKSCAESAVKSAKFPKTQKGVTVSYPFVLR